MITDEDGLRDFLVNYTYVTSKLRIPMASNAIRLLKLAYENEDEEIRPTTFTDVARVLIHALVCVELEEEELELLVDQYIQEHLDPEELSEFIDFADEGYSESEEEDEEDN